MTPKTAPDSPDFTERIATLQQVAYPGRTAVGGRPGVQRSLEALQAAHTTAIEALRVAIEKLHQQHNELVSTRQALETERQRYQELFDWVPDGYLVTDAYGTIREANRAAALLLNVSPQALIGKSLLPFVVQKEQRTFPTWLSQRLQARQAQE